MRSDTLVIDIGQNLVGVYSVVNRKYVPYRGECIRLAIERIEKALEVVTYNGNRYDIVELQKLKKGLGIEGELRIRGRHTDMQEVCWSTRILGSSLYNTYNYHFSTVPPFPDTHEGSNRTDVYKTFKLWRLWKQDRLRILDGQYLQAQHNKPSQRTRQRAARR